MSQKMTPLRAGMLWLATVVLALAFALATPVVSTVQRHAAAHEASNGPGLLIQTREDTVPGRHRQ